jgi:S-adenosylmethionine:tRNA ribosyltransferase-isomerase
MRTDEFDYDLPPELIAQTPGVRGDSRLLVLHRDNGDIEHRRFSDVPDFLSPADLLVLNDTRVTARRIRALRENGHEAEVLLLHPMGDRGWAALIRPGRVFRRGCIFTLLGDGAEQLRAEITGVTPEGGRIFELASTARRDALAHWGTAPLPPYIHVPLPATEEHRYQTVYATHGGSAAAPTAGLHFTPELLSDLDARGVQQTRVTLHVGVGTFRPVRSESIEDHEMHAETAILPLDAAERINATTGRVVAVGTTSVRTLESAAQAGALLKRQGDGRVTPFAGETRLFITPGYSFRAVDAMITNFHLPRSTLLMLVSAFAGVEATRNAYRAAIDRQYRFFSFGDAMLIV